ncbi:unnamed protein product [Mytilus edulis]|uniref:Uncharacterized protein n=1 Tax=Mytilus edulis TaxID=6550 RepID=A0A8S3TI55_MYTED|nr:unnamed protein product [Mytilus edulis]
MADPPQTSVQVLKHKHSMLGESLLPAIAKLKAWDPDANSGELCRLKKGHPLEEYSLVQLRTEFERLAGESVKDIFAIVGIDENLKSVRQLVHLTILQGNLVGISKGQALQYDLQVRADNLQAPRTTVTQSSGSSGMSGANVDICSRSKDTQNLQLTLSS